MLFPKIVGADEAVSNLDDAVWYWVVVAIGFNVLAFGAYVALFRGVLGGTRDDDVHRRLDLRASYQITMAGLAATRIFSAAGVGGIVLTYWALRKAGVPRRRAACRMVAFLVLTYFVYLAALVAFGVLLRMGVLHGEDAARGHRGPGGDLRRDHRPVPDDRRDPATTSSGASSTTRAGTGARATCSGSRRARPRSPWARAPRSPTSATRSRGLLAVGGAVGFWAANIGDPVGELQGVRRRTSRSACSSRASSSGWRPT